ncbi:cytochrome C biogenesis protein [Bacterioplanes sanyensis]|uniref:Cytochrome C biogenesis protein n=1 Tax=Bacterioplanes sanyensis TaxID=1249553 RepID=A0A222FKE6_9GAMM|nr:cytochrome c biogenesis protein CcdA [Bacterioplanes sanyensis]ASP38703.1 cytochrome C biogenesis protein [Bacterioplanes sanyensis]
MEALIQSALQAQDYSLWVVALVFATGVLTSLTPCVYPMIPVTAAVIGHQASKPASAVWLTLVYVLCLALVYALLGVLAASSGQLFGSVASHPLTLVVMASFCWLMAAWMMGWVRIPMPQWSSSNRHSALLNVAIAGLLSGLVMAPCTSPVLGMLLLYVASQGDQLWAALLMFAFAVGMSLLLMAVGSFSGLLNRLPKSGAWMTLVTRFFAALMALAGAFFLLRSLFPHLF